MSTFITGVPGTGKTAQVVAELVERRKQNPNVKIYQHGIRELSLDHIQVYCNSDECLACRDVDKTGKLQASEWYEWGKPGDLIVLDEVQRIWSPRHVSAKRPKGVSMLETHRHFGVEFWMMSQHPKLVDSDVRRQMRKHIHAVAAWSGRKLYEWDTVSDDLKISTARERPFKLPAEIFGMYKSADAHIEISRKKPLSFYATIAALCCAVVFAGFAAYRVKSRTETKEEGGASAVLAPQDSPRQNDAVGVTNAEGMKNDFKPAIENRPETAPAYAHLLQVKSVPTLAGCIKSKNSCKCYTNQATPYPVTHLQCLEHVANLHFNPYAAPPGFRGGSASDSQQNHLSENLAAAKSTPLNNKNGFDSVNAIANAEPANDLM